MNTGIFTDSADAVIRGLKIKEGIFMLVMLCLMVTGCNINGAAKSIPTRNTLPFTKGYNLDAHAENIDIKAGLLTDIKEIKAMGGDVVRFVYKFFAQMNNETHALNPSLIENIRFVIDQLASNPEYSGMSFIIDNHSFKADYEKASQTYAISKEDLLLRLWEQLAAALKDTPDFVYFEIQNEPFNEDFYDKETYFDAIAQVVAHIRAIDSRHAIVLGHSTTAHPFFSAESLQENGIVLTEHFYDPFLFTHQGAWWTHYEDVTGIPFPYNEQAMPSAPAGKELLYESYKTESNFDTIREKLDVLVSVSKSKGVPLFIGEWGNLKTSVKDNTATVAYAKFMADELRARNLPWIAWDYMPGFGPYNYPVKTGFPETDYNYPVLSAMGFSPKQQLTVPGSDFILFDDDTHFCDYMHTWDSGAVYRYDTDSLDGIFAFYVSNGLSDFRFMFSQYAEKKVPDIQRMQECGYAIDFDAKADGDLNLYVRFLDNAEKQKQKVVALRGNGQYHHYSVKIDEMAAAGDFNIENLQSLSFLMLDGSVTNIKFDTIILKAP